MNVTCFFNDAALLSVSLIFQHLPQSTSSFWLKVIYIKKINRNFFLFCEIKNQLLIFIFSCDNKKTLDLKKKIRSGWIFIHISLGSDFVNWKYFLKFVDLKNRYLVKYQIFVILINIIIIIHFNVICITLTLLNIKKTE